MLIHSYHRLSYLSTFFLAVLFLSRSALQRMSSLAGWSTYLLIQISSTLCSSCLGFICALIFFFISFLLVGSVLRKRLEVLPVKITFFLQLRRGGPVKGSQRYRYMLQIHFPNTTFGNNQSPKGVLYRTRRL